MVIHGWLHSQLGFSDPDCILGFWTAWSTFLFDAVIVVAAAGVEVVAGLLPLAPAPPHAAELPVPDSHRCITIPGSSDHRLQNRFRMRILGHAQSQLRLAHERLHGGGGADAAAQPSRRRRTTAAARGGVSIAIAVGGGDCRGGLGRLCLWWTVGHTYQPRYVGKLLS